MRNYYRIWFKHKEMAYYRGGSPTDFLLNHLRQLNRCLILAGETQGIHGAYAHSLCSAV